MAWHVQGRGWDMREAWDLRQEMPTRDPSQAAPTPPRLPGQEPEALEGAVRGGRGKEVWVGSGPSALGGVVGSPGDERIAAPLAEPGVPGSPGLCRLCSPAADVLDSEALALTRPAPGLGRASPAQSSPGPSAS